MGVPQPQDQVMLLDETPVEAQVPIGDAAHDSPVPKPVARVGGDSPADRPQFPSVSAPSGVTSHGGRGRRLLLAVGKRLATIAIALVAALIALLTWQDYVRAPWTRNGSVRVQVANIAPQVSGQIVELRVADDQFVREGDVLYVIDPSDFQVAVGTSKATVDQEAANLQVKKVESDRRQHLTNLTTTPEEQQTYAGNAAQAKAQFDAAQQQLAQAELNLKRTKVLSPVNGYVTNLLLRVGNYAPTGITNISVIDSDSFWIDGYFEETKMARICVGDRAEAKLMGYAEPIIGHVETVTRGISVSNAAPGTQGLPNVDPIYTWVRLAQRVPVRIAIDKIPAGVPLVSGMTATVTIRPVEGTDHRNWFDRVRSDVAARFSELLYGSASRPGCLAARAGEHRATETIPVPTESPAASPEQISPGIAPGMDVSPHSTDQQDR